MAVHEKSNTDKIREMQKERIEYLFTTADIKNPLKINLDNPLDMKLKEELNILGYQVFVL